MPRTLPNSAPPSAVPPTAVGLAPGRAPPPAVDVPWPRTPPPWLCPRKDVWGWPNAVERIVRARPLSLPPPPTPLPGRSLASSFLGGGGGRRSGWPWWRCGRPATGSSRSTRRATGPMRLAPSLRPPRRRRRGSGGCALDAEEGAWKSEATMDGVRFCTIRSAPGVRTSSVRRPCLSTLLILADGRSTLSEFCRDSQRSTDDEVAALALDPPRFGSSSNSGGRPDLDERPPNAMCGAARPSSRDGTSVQNVHRLKLDSSIYGPDSFRFGLPSASSAASSAAPSHAHSASRWAPTATGLGPARAGRCPVSAGPTTTAACADSGAGPRPRSRWHTRHGTTPRSTACLGPLSAGALPSPADGRRSSTGRPRRLWPTGDWRLLPTGDWRLDGRPRRLWPTGDWRLQAPAAVRRAPSWIGGFPGISIGTGGGAFGSRPRTGR